MKTPDEIRGLVERQILEAAARGEFDNLPGAGRPLDLTENPYVAPEWRLAFKVLKDGGLAPEFVERRRRIESLRAELEAAEGEATLRRIATVLAAEVEALNRCLAREHEFVRGSLQLPPVDVEAEVRQRA
jgi:DnaJ-like protein